MQASNLGDLAVEYLGFGRGLNILVLFPTLVYTHTAMSCDLQRSGSHGDSVNLNIIRTG